MKVTYYPYKHPGDSRHGADKPVWNWHQVLIDEVRIAMEKGSEKFNLGQFAPIGAFHEAPMRGHLASFTKEMMVEIDLPHNDKIRTDLEKSISPVWIAEIVHMLGYYILVRWCGSKKSDGFFWIHAANAHVHQVGYTEANRQSGYTLCPPAHVYSNLESPALWVEYQQSRIIGKKTPSGSFDLRGKEVAVNKFKTNERVETIHDEESSVIAPAIIKRILGRRILIEYNKSDIDKADLIEKENMWKDMNDDLIYPVGFAETMGLRMTANKKYRAHVAEIAKAIKEGETDVPYTRYDAKRDTVYQWRENLNATAVWEEQMVCEMIDRLDECQNILKAARVLRVLPDGYLQLGPEGADILNDSFHIHQTSPILFPVGFAQKHGITLQGPNGDNEEAFEWKSFLSRTTYKVAPDHFFHEATEKDVPFTVGTRLEAIDQNEKMLLCPATVKAIKGRLVLVSFDGWDEEFDQLYDFRSNELLPCGWGEMIGHALQRPEKAKETELVAEEVVDEAMEDE